MSKIINLNRARKARSRAEAKQKADRNAAAFGVSKAAKAAAKAESALEAQRLDAHRRDSAKSVPDDGVPS